MSVAHVDNKLFRFNFFLIMDIIRYFGKKWFETEVCDREDQEEWYDLVIINSTIKFMIIYRNIIINAVIILL